MTFNNSRPSLQSIIKSRRQAAFIGREAQLESFRRNINLPVEDPQRRFIFNIYGQGGVGKTTLLQQFSKILTESTATASAYTSEAETNVLEVMARIAIQFKEIDCPLKAFSERYQVYRQKCQELETDPEAPKNLPAFIGRSVVKIGASLGRSVPGVGVGLSLINEDALAEQAGDLVAYLARKLANKDEVLLVREPVNVLTSLFLADLQKVAETRTLALFFDTYENTSEFLDAWLLNLLGGMYGDLPSNIVLTIAGRYQLNRNVWSPYEALICYQQLDAFNEEEFKAYLYRKGITDEHVAEVIDRLSGRLPLLVATLANGAPSKQLTTDDQSETAVDRFLKWVKDARQRQLALDASLLRLLNKDVLAVLVNNNIDESFAWLKENPFVIAHSDGWAYHEVVRNQMLRYKLRESPQGWAGLHDRLGAYYEILRDNVGVKEEEKWTDAAWQKYALEALYHRLCQSPVDQLEVATGGFIEALRGDWSYPRRWAETVEQAGRDLQQGEVEHRGKQMTEVVRAYTSGDFRAAAEAFTPILSIEGFKGTWRASALEWRGYIYYLIGQTEKALNDFNEAIELDPTDSEHWTYRGLTLAETGCYEEALADLDHALKLEPTNKKAIVGRGRVHIETGNDAEALADIDKALAIDTDDMMLLIVRLCFLLKKGDPAELGRTYIALATRSNRLVEQAHDIQEGISKIPLEVINRHLRSWGLTLGVDESSISNTLTQWQDLMFTDPNGFTNAIQGLAANAEAIMYAGTRQFDEALTACNSAIELCPLDPHFRFVRGEVHFLMNKLPEALADYSSSLNINPDNAVILTKRAQVHQRMGKYNDALEDVDAALAMSPENPLLVSMRQTLLEQIKSSVE